jgi:hypothetical protein
MSLYMCVFVCIYMCHSMPKSTIVWGRLDKIIHNPTWIWGTCVEPWCLCCSSLHSLCNVSVSLSSNTCPWLFSLLILIYTSWTCNRTARPHQELNVGFERSMAYILTKTTPNQNKVTLKFCVLIQCTPKLLCYCCLTQKPKPLCYYNVHDCQASCPDCNPTCPPVPSPSA